jgi:hypothetical protein
MRHPRGAATSLGAIAFFVAGAIVFLAIVAPSRAAAYGDTLAHPRTTPQYWVTTSGTDTAIDRVDPFIAGRVFRAAHSVALGGWAGSITGAAWASEAEFASDVRSGNIPSDVRAVMYDPEGWDSTPRPEQRDPALYAERFVWLAHANGYIAIVTPHPSLVSVPGSVCGQRADETQEAAYVRCRIAEKVAKDADLYETQAQALERDPSAYRDFVARTARQARSANPDVIVLSGLSTAPGYVATAQMLYAAWDSVKDVVDGHYLSLVRVEYPGAAAAFLRLIAGGSN